MHPPCVPGWVDDPTVKAYSCGGTGGGVDATTARIWRNACGGPSKRYSSPTSPVPRKQRYHSCAAPWSAGRALRLLHNKTVAIVGDSMAINLFCALTCAMVRDGDARFGPRQPGPLEGTFALSIEDAEGRHRSRWVLPSCAGGSKGRCWFGHNSMGANCGAESLVKLHAAAGRGEGLVVLHNPCGAHANSALPHLARALANVSLDAFAEWPSLFAQRPCRPSAAVAGGGGGGCAAGVERQRLAAAGPAYAAVARRAAESLARIYSAHPGTLAMLIESAPAHNPALPGCLGAALAGLPEEVVAEIDGSEWEGYALSLLEFARQLSQRRSGRGLLRRLNISQPAVLASGDIIYIVLL